MTKGFDLGSLKSMVDQGVSYTHFTNTHRADALAHFSQLAGEVDANELWKYSNLGFLKSKFYSPAPNDSIVNPTVDLNRYQVQMSFVNGASAKIARNPRTPNSLVVDSLSDFLSGKGRIQLTSTLGQQFLEELSLSQDGTREPLAQLNRALFKDGALIYVPPGTGPVTISIHSQVNAAQADSVPFVNLRHLIFIDSQASAEIVEFDNGSDTPSLVNVRTQVIQSAGSQFKYARVRSGASHSQFVGSLHLKCGRDAKSEIFSALLGGGFSRVLNEALLLEPGAHCSMNGIYLSKESEHHDYRSVMRHLAPHTGSDQLYKGILKDQSRAIFNGKIEIVKDAQQVNSVQVNKNLLLSSKAEVDTKPELEIHADDVKANHGATVGQLDPEHIFYLRSRGLTESEATEFLTHGFLMDVLNKLTGNNAVAVKSLAAKPLAEF